MATSELDAKDLARIDKLMGRLPLALRGKALKKALKKASAPVAKEYRIKLPRGDKASTPEIKPISRVVSTQTKQNNDGTIVMARTGAKVQKGKKEGWYANLLEVGFKHTNTEAHIPGKFPLTKAINKTKHQSKRILIQELVKAIVAEGG